jgi:hypothetical protein
VHCKRIFYIGTGIQRENGGIFGDETMSRDINKVYKTECGLFAKYENFVMSTIKILYKGEENLCIPCKAKKCMSCNNILVSTPNLVNTQLSGFKACIVRETEEEYNDEQSINKIVREMNEKFYEEKKKLEKGHWFGCPNILQEFDKAVKRYDLRQCKEFNCMNDVCVVTGGKRNTELVNIFYDIKHVEQRGFLTFESWEKDLKYFEHSVPRDLAEKYIRIIEKEEPEKLNLRIQARKTKSLEKDLEKIFIRG